jgi:hypothetical protein
MKVEQANPHRPLLMLLCFVAALFCLIAALWLTVSIANGQTLRVSTGSREHALTDPR